MAAVFNHLDGSTVAVDHGDGDVRGVGAKSYKLVQILVVNISHLQRTNNAITVNKRSNRPSE